VTEQRRRLADRILDSGRTVAQTYADLDRFDPHRPLLGQIVAEALADHERTGEERVLDRVRKLVEQRTKLRDERLDLALRYAREGNLSPAASELRWASDLDQQIGALRLLLVEPADPDDSPETVPGPGRLGQDRTA
jgi:hypothetical protein